MIVALLVLLCAALLTCDFDSIPVIPHWRHDGEKHVGHGRHGIQNEDLFRSMIVQTQGALGKGPIGRGLWRARACFSQMQIFLSENQSASIFRPTLLI
jgi:hypothetical protein